METTAENYQGKSRHDHFLGSGVARLLAVSGNGNRFEGQDLRLSLDPGLACYFLDEERTRLSTEVGCDLQYDARRDENPRPTARGRAELDETRVRHKSRVFGGDEANPNDAVMLGIGLEDLSEPSGGASAGRRE